MKHKTARTENAAAPSGQLRLYVAKESLKSMRALENLKIICQQRLKNRFRLKVIDLRPHPRLGRGDQILATLTLVRKLPRPLKVVIGDLSKTESVLVGLDLQPGGKR